METEKMYRFLHRSKSQLEVIKEDTYQFGVRVNEKDEIQLNLYWADGHLIVYTDWERYDDQPYYFQDCIWAEKTLTCDLEDFTEIDLRVLVEEAENILSICLSK